jgi:hypothetical protein
VPKEANGSVVSERAADWLCPPMTESFDGRQASIPAHPPYPGPGHFLALGLKFCNHAGGHKPYSQDRTATSIYGTDDGLVDQESWKIPCFLRPGQGGPIQEATTPSLRKASSWVINLRGSLAWTNSSRWSQPR